MPVPLELQAVLVPIIMFLISRVLLAIWRFITWGFGSKLSYPPAIVKSLKPDDESFWEQIVQLRKEAEKEENGFSWLKFIKLWFMLLPNSFFRSLSWKWPFIIEPGYNLVKMLVFVVLMIVLWLVHKHQETLFQKFIAQPFVIMITVFITVVIGIAMMSVVGWLIGKQPSKQESALSKCLNSSDDLVDTFFLLLSVCMAIYGSFMIARKWITMGNLGVYLGATAIMAICVAFILTIVFIAILYCEVRFVWKKLSKLGSATVPTVYQQVIYYLMSKVPIPETIPEVMQYASTTVFSLEIAFIVGLIIVGAYIHIELDREKTDRQEDTMEYKYRRCSDMLMGLTMGVFVISILYLYTTLYVTGEPQFKWQNMVIFGFVMLLICIAIGIKSKF